jgi:hypothetical protein
MDRVIKLLTAPWSLLLILIVVTGLVFETTPNPLVRSWALMLLANIGGFFVALTWHEMGHMLAGFLVRFKFVTITIGPFMFIKKSQGVALRLVNHWSRMLGFNIFLPPNDIKLRERLIVYIAGGPAASLLLTLIAFGIISIHQPTYDDFLQNAPLWTLLKLVHYTFLWSFGILALSVAPGIGIPTDGSKLTKLIPGDLNAERWVAVTLVGFAILKGERPRNWDMHWIDGLTTLHDRSADAAVANYLAYRWALDCKNEQLASQYLDRMIESRMLTAPSTRAGLLVEAAYFEMRYRRDLVKAQDWLSQAGARQKWAPRITRLRMGCAASLVLNQPEMTRQIAAQALAMLNQGYDGISLGEQALFHDLLDQSEKAA